MYRWVEHTGELELEIEAPSRQEVFDEAFRAMRELLRSPRTEPTAPREVRLNASDAAALLADWLAELAYLAESDGFVPERLERLELDETDLAARLQGFRGDPPHLVKAATYHRLSLEPSRSGWRATAVLDV